MAEPVIVSDSGTGDGPEPPNWAAAVKLYLEHKEEARRAAAWILGSRFDPEVEDVIQEAIVNAAQRFHTLREPERGRNWFLKIVSNRALDVRRARSRRSGKESPIGSAELQLMSRGLSPEKSLHMLDARDFMNTLPEKQRVAYLLVHFFSFDHEDTGEVLNCSARTVSTHLRRAQAKIDMRRSKE
jgi:RNA polymerase sigma-70 factor (ECF subfamily)